MLAKRDTRRDKTHRRPALESTVYVSRSSHFRIHRLILGITILPEVPSAHDRVDVVFDACPCLARAPPTLGLNQEAPRLLAPSSLERCPDPPGDRRCMPNFMSARQMSFDSSRSAGTDGCALVAAIESVPHHILTFPFGTPYSPHSSKHSEPQSEPLISFSLFPLPPPRPRVCGGWTSVCL